MSRDARVFEDEVEDEEERGESLINKEIDKEKKALEKYWRSQLDLVSSAFSQSKDSFLKIVQWFFAIGTGTLLWFSGNFDKYKITSNINTATEYTAFMPMKELYFSSLLMLVLSVIGSAIIIILVYYNQYLSDIALDKFNSFTKEILARYDLLKTEQDSEKKDRLDEEICQNIIQSTQPFNAFIEAKRKVAEIIINKNTKNTVIMCSILYLIGLLLGIVHLILFIYRYR